MIDRMEAAHQHAVNEMACFDSLPPALRAYLAESGLSAGMTWALWSRWPDEGNVLAMLEQARGQIKAGYKELRLTPPQMIIANYSGTSTSASIGHWGY